MTANGHGAAVHNRSASFGNAASLAIRDRVNRLGHGEARLAPGPSPLLAACGHGSPRGPAAALAKDAARPARRAPLIEVPAQPLGDGRSRGVRLAQARRPGRVSAARARPRTGSDWAAVATACKAGARAPIPATSRPRGCSRSRSRRPASSTRCSRRSQLAVAGDFGKWGDASLEQPALQPFLATPVGQAWRRRVEDDRAAYLAALARAVDRDVATAISTRSIRERTRWLPADAHVRRGDRRARRRARRTASRTSRASGKKGKRELGVGIVDLATGHTPRADRRRHARADQRRVQRDDSRTGVLRSAPARDVARARRRRQARRRCRAKTDAASRPWLEVDRHDARGSHRAAGRRASPADWDDQGLASAIRIGTSNRVVTVPSPG